MATSLRTRVFAAWSRVRPHQGHKPGWSDVRGHGLPFEARPNFYYFEGCGRPCWLPIYPEPRIMVGCSLTRNWPFELWKPPNGSRVGGHYVKVIRQVRGEGVRNEILQYSDVWNLILIPKEHIDPRTRHLTDQDPEDDRYYLGFAADLWLGNTGWHQPTPFEGPSWQRR